MVFTRSALEPGEHPETIVMKARRLGLVTSRLPSLDEGGEALRLSPVNAVPAQAAPASGAWRDGDGNLIAAPKR